jgi:hypothetical protein
MDFGAPGSGAPRSIVGNVLQRNIFYFYGQRADRAMLASQVGWSADFLKANGSNANLFYSPDMDASQAPLFPGRRSFMQWTGQNKTDSGPVTCHTPGSAATMVVDGGCSWGWDHNSTSQLLTARPPHGKAWDDTYKISVDCDGSWANCDDGTPSTRICVDPYAGDWQPLVHPLPGQVQNCAWKLNASGALVNQPNGKCVEVCLRGGAVGGCNGEAGSIVQLRSCTGSPKQTWHYNSGDGTIRSALGTRTKPLCLGPPSHATTDSFDTHSIVANPKFSARDPVASGNFDLQADSPALELLGFTPIPPITAPQALCGEGMASCLSLVL